jgi:hypothetical protein
MAQLQEEQQQQEQHPEQRPKQRTSALEVSYPSDEKDRSVIAGLLTILSLFVALPLVMYLLKVPAISIFAVTIFGAGLLADIFTTKAGFNRGFSEYNIFYNLLNKGRRRVKNNSFLIGGFFFGLIRLGLIYYFWSEPVVLLLLASLSLLGPVWNSIMLAYPESQKNQKRMIRESFEL